MRTLSTELSAWIDRVGPAPRVYADANVPAGLVGFMRHDLGWDVFFVMEHDDLRRAADTEHFRLARQLHRTLVTLDHDYFDDQRFPPSESGGVIVLSAPDERQLARLLRRVDRRLLRPGGPAATLPLAGHKLHAQPETPPPRRARRRRR
jgi:hypothetical protein